MRLSRTSGVSPIVSRIESRMSGSVMAPSVRGASSAPPPLSGGMRPLLASLLLLLLLPASASAGGYSVSACFGMENASWTAWRPTPGATAYWNCPGGVDRSGAAARRVTG